MLQFVKAADEWHCSTAELEDGEESMLKRLKAEAWACKDQEERMLKELEADAGRNDIMTLQTEFMQQQAVFLDLEAAIGYQF